MSLKHFFTILLIGCPIATVIGIETGMYIRQTPFKTAHAISQKNGAENEKLKTHLDVLGARLAKCANLPKPSLAFINKAEFDTLFPKYRDRNVEAITTTLTILDIVAARKIYIVFNKQFINSSDMPEAEFALAHEIGHHIFEPTIYDKLINGFLPWGPTDLQREFMATALGAALIKKCSEQKI